MSGFSRRKCMVFIMSCALFVLISAGLMFCYRNYLNSNEIWCSAESGMYEEGTVVELSLYREGQIFYSLNDAEFVEYQGAIVLNAGEHGQWYDMSCYGVFKDGTETEKVQYNYFVTRMDEKPVTTDYIVSIRGDEDELFSDERGLLVRGNLFREYMEENPEVDILNTVIPANYFSDEEIAVHCVIFDGNGVELFDRICGFNIYGAVSRAKNQKSFRLTSRYIYGEENSFDYAFFPELTNEAGGEILEYKKLSFHNSGNDNGYAFIRNQLGGELARQQGFPDVLVSKSVAVYINDRYMGMYWLQNAFGEKYFEEKYGAYDGEMAVLEGGVMQVKSAEENSVREKAAEEYNEFCQWVVSADIQDDSVWEKITDTIDVQNFMQYVAIEYYVNNSDWPHNNFKTYRYVASDGVYYEDSVFDGRYRYLLYDLDCGMGYMFWDTWGQDAYTDTLYYMCNEEPTSRLIGKLLERKECRYLFANEIMNLINGSFSADNMKSTLDRINISRWNECTYMMENTDIFEDSLWDPMEYFTREHITEELNEIREFADIRPLEAIRELQDVLGDLGDLVNVEIAGEDKISVSINGLVTEHNKKSIQFTDVPLEISAEANKGVLIKGYFVNDCYVVGENVQIVPKDYAVDGLITIIPDWEEQECESLCIAAYRTGGNQDYVVLKNDGNVNIRLAEYYLSDDEENIYKKQLTDEILEPGETITFYGETEEERQGAGVYHLSFSWNDEEYVILSNVASGVIEKKALGILGLK